MLDLQRLAPGCRRPPNVMLVLGPRPKKVLAIRLNAIAVSLCELYGSACITGVKYLLHTSDCVVGHIANESLYYFD